MIQRVFLLCLAGLLLLSTGCLFSKKTEKRKESSAIAGEVEANFKQRWIDKRVAELVAQGEAPDFARGRAAREFGEKFEFNTKGKK